MSTIFISHSSQDNEIAREIGRRLTSQGHHSVFLDIDPEKGLVGGQSWERTLYRKLRACRAVIALCTDHYLDSHWCFAEIALARMEGKHLIALQADPLNEQAQMPAILTERQFIDLRRDRDEGYQRLWLAMKALDLPVVPEDWEPNKPPYLGLSAYQEEHAPVFFGREAESQGGIELLNRGAPGLIMVLGASGSGKSSLVRAGMLPRLRSRKDEWLIVDPFRPGRDPMAELTESLVQNFHRYAPERKGLAVNRQRIREKLFAELPVPASNTGPDAVESEAPDQILDASEDERLRHLIDLLERLRQDPPPMLAGRLRDYLNWSLDDLRRIYDGPDEVVKPPEIISHGTTALVEIVRDLRRVSRRRGARVLLVIDQFEELLGRQATDKDVGHFLALLRASIEVDHSPLMILGTMRSDFLGLFQRDAALRGIDFESLSLGPMKIEGMRRVIEEPAKLAAIELESGLADRLLKDTETPDALPLLSFTLEVLWRNHHDDHKFEIADYEKLGGLQGAITGEADAVLAFARRRNREDDLRKALLQMARLSEDGSYARRPVDWEKEEIRRVEPILQKLITRRVLVSRLEGEKRIVEVAHEALFRAWKPLRGWLDNARSELLLHQQLERDARTWRAGSRATDTLWRGGRLLQARDLLGKQNLRNAAKKDNLVAEFVLTGLRRRLRLAATAVMAIFIVIAVLTGFLIYARVQEGLARKEKARALDLARVAIASEWLDKDPTKAALVLIEVEDPDNTRFAPRKLSEALNRGFVGIEYPHAGPVHSVAISSDGQQILTTSDKLATVWETHTGRIIHRLQHETTIIDGSFDPTGKFVVTRSGEIGEIYPYDRVGDTAWVWNLKTGNQYFAAKHDAQLNAAVFSPQGRFLVTASDDTTAKLWDMKSGQLMHPLNHDRSVTDASFSPDGKQLVTASGEAAQLWDVKTGKMGRKLENGKQAVTAALFNSKGSLVVAMGYRKPIVWDTVSGDIKYTLDHHGAQIASFSPTGRYLLTASDDKALVWNLATGNKYSARAMLHDNLIAASYITDGLVFTASGHLNRKGYGVARADNKVRFWNVKKGQEHLIRNLKHDHEVMTVVFGSGYNFAVTNSAERVGGGRGETLVADATVRLWNVGIRDRRQIYELAHDQGVSSAAFNPGGNRLLTRAGSAVRLWDVPTGKLQFTLSHADLVTNAFFGPHGRYVITASKDKTARIWDVDTGRQQFLITHEQAVKNAWLIANGSLLATIADRTLRVWRTASGAASIGSALFSLDLGQSGGVRPGSFSPDGNLLVLVSEKAAQVWDVEKNVKRFTLAHNRRVRTAAFTEDGGLLVTRSDENTARAWDMKNGETKFIFGQPGHARETLVSSDGRSVITLSKDNTAILWNAETGDERFSLEHKEDVSFVRFIATGRLAVSGSCRDSGNYCEIKVWEVETGKEQAVFGFSPPTSFWRELVRFSPNGKLMFTLFGNNTHRYKETLVRVWDLETAEERFDKPFRSDKRLKIIDFSPDSKRLLMKADYAKKVEMWAISGDLLQAAVSAATTVCLEPEFRRLNLGESETEAYQNWKACERSHGRE